MKIWVIDLVLEIEKRRFKVQGSWVSWERGEERRGDGGMAS